MGIDKTVEIELECPDCGGEGGEDSPLQCGPRCDWCGGCSEPITCEKCEGEGMLVYDIPSAVAKEIERLTERVKYLCSK